MPDRVLSDETDQQLTAARRLLGDLQVELATVPATAADAATLADSVRQLDELFLLVVVGEFNAGKSAFINALLGSKVLDEGRHPDHRTDSPHPLRRDDLERTARLRHPRRHGARRLPQETSTSSTRRAPTRSSASTSA